MSFRSFRQSLMSVLPSLSTTPRDDALPPTQMYSADHEQSRDRLRKELEAAKKQLEGWRSKFAVIQAEQQVTEETLVEANQLAGELYEKLDRKQDKIQNLRTRLHKSEDTAIHAVQSAENFQRELESLRREHSKTVALLQNRTTELEEARVFLTKADTHSDTDIVRMVEHINSEIFQISAQIADSLQFAATISRQYFPVPDVLRRLIGAGMTAMLLSVQHHDDPICVQIGLQACMVAFAGWIMGTWDFNQSACGDIFSTALDNIYEHMRNSELQSVSGRWRALTLRQLRGMLAERVDERSLGRTLLGHLTNVLIASGPDGSPQEIHHNMLETYAQRINLIVKLCLDLRKISGEDVIAGVFEIVLVPFERPFDRNYMDDANATDHSTNDPSTMRHIGHQILCTTALGLRRLRMTSTQKNDKGGAQDVHVSVLLKPQVALVGFLQELAEGN